MPFIDSSGTRRDDCRTATTVTAAAGAVDPRLRHHNIKDECPALFLVSTRHVITWRLRLDNFSIELT